MAYLKARFTVISLVFTDVLSLTGQTLSTHQNNKNPFWFMNLQSLYKSIILDLYSNKLKK